VAKILVTGMSGTGKSTALALLGQRGYRVVDTDSDQWCEWVVDSAGEPDWVWRVEPMTALLSSPGTLFVAGCKTNQGRFYPAFDAVALLSAPVPVLLARVAARETNPYGRSAADRAEIVRYAARVEPLLRAGATVEIDASGPVTGVVDQLAALAEQYGGCVD
jgi:AAA domain-containing protein